MEQINKGSVRPVFFLKVLAFSYVLTVASLMLLALLLYKFRFGEMVVNVGIILIYILACFVSGFLTGKRMERRKFLWGFVVGLGYFIILLLVSFGLKSYYQNGLWLEDYESDERGELPRGLKRGVLSQDALYNFLSDLD